MQLPRRRHLAAVETRFRGHRLVGERPRLVVVALLPRRHVVALGAHYCGLFSPDSALAEAIQAAGERADDRAWRLPLHDGYREWLKSDVADIINSHSNGFAGASVAALFLDRFVPEGIDWVCVSPKAEAELVVHEGDELKVVVPQDGLDLATLEGLRFDHWFVQPMDGAEGSTEWAVDWCRRHPNWRLSLQTHKYLGIP